MSKRQKKIQSLLKLGSWLKEFGSNKKIFMSKENFPDSKTLKNAIFQIKESAKRHDADKIIEILAKHVEGYSKYNEN